MHLREVLRLLQVLLTRFVFLSCNTLIGAPLAAGVRNAEAHDVAAQIPHALVLRRRPARGGGPQTRRHGLASEVCAIVCGW